MMKTMQNRSSFQCFIYMLWCKKNERLWMGTCSMDATNVTKKAHEANDSCAIKLPWSWGFRPANSLNLSAHHSELHLSLLLQPSSQPLYDVNWGQQRDPWLVPSDLDPAKNDLFPTVLAIRVFFCATLLNIPCRSPSRRFALAILARVPSPSDPCPNRWQRCGSMNQPIDMTRTAVEAPSHQRGRQSCVEWHLSRFISAWVGWSSILHRMKESNLKL